MSGLRHFDVLTSNLASRFNSKAPHIHRIPSLIFYENLFHKNVEPDNPGGGGGGDTPYNGLYVEAPPERGTRFKLDAYEFRCSGFRCSGFHELRYRVKCERALMHLGI